MYGVVSTGQFTEIYRNIYDLQKKTGKRIHFALQPLKTHNLSFPFYVHVTDICMENLNAIPSLPVQMCASNFINKIFYCLTLP